MLTKTHFTPFIPMIECLHTWTSSGIGLYTKFLALVWGSMISTRPVRMPPRGPQESTRIPHRTAPEMFIEPPIVKTKLKATWSVKAADMIWQTADASNKYLPSSSKLIAPCFFFWIMNQHFLGQIWVRKRCALHRWQSHHKDDLKTANYVFGTLTWLATLT